MFDMNEILTGKKSTNKPRKDLFDIDRILPKIAEEKEIKPIMDKQQKVIVHNHYYNSMPNNIMRVKKQKKFSLSALNGTRPFDDDDKDGYPNYMDPYPKDPTRPKKKLIWEKTLNSIYRNDED